jgi:uncharacterized membrane protein YbaN (DUF454 family)
MIKIIYFSLGCIFFMLGAVGLFLPLLPTTCFWLFAAWTFSKSSDRFHEKLIRHKKFGPIYADWQRDKSISVKVKKFALTSILLSTIVSCLILTGQFAAQILLISIMLLLSIYLLHLPTNTKESVAQNH